MLIYRSTDNKISKGKYKLCPVPTTSVVASWSFYFNLGFLRGIEGICVPGANMNFTVSFSKLLQKDCLLGILIGLSNPVDNFAGVMQVREKGQKGYSNQQRMLPQRKRYPLETFASRLTR